MQPPWAGLNGRTLQCGAWRSFPPKGKSPLPQKEVYRGSSVGAQRSRLRTRPYGLVHGERLGAALTGYTTRGEGNLEVSVDD